MWYGKKSTVFVGGARKAAGWRTWGHNRIIHLKTLHLGPEELLVAAKISVGAADIGKDTAAAIDDAESRIRTAVPMARVIYLEPDLHREDGPHAGQVPGAGRISAEAGPTDGQA